MAKLKIIEYVVWQQKMLKPRSLREALRNEKPLAVAWQPPHSMLLSHMHWFSCRSQPEGFSALWGYFGARPWILEASATAVWQDTRKPVSRLPSQGWQGKGELRDDLGYIGTQEKSLQDSFSSRQLTAKGCPARGAAGLGKTKGQKLAVFTASKSTEPNTEETEDRHKWAVGT